MFNELRFALRQILRNPGFTAVAVATLALGIGVNTTMFSVLNALVLRESGARDPGRLVALFRTSDQSQDRPQAPASFYDFVSQQTSFEAVGAYYQTNYNLAEAGQPAERLAGMAASGNIFRIFGIGPELGSVFGPEYDQAGREPVAVISDGYWRSHFAADPSIVGRKVRMDGQPVTIIGVLPDAIENPLYWGHIDVWRPMALDSASRQIRDNYWIQSIGRLKAGVSLGQAQAEASAIASRLARDYPATNSGTGLRLDPWEHARTGNLSRQISWLCMVLAGFVLLIACANLANLQLARISSRVREQAVRLAVGASRLQVVRQLLAESLILSLIGGSAGVLIAFWGTRMIGGSLYIAGVRGFDIAIDPRVLAFTIAASVVAGAVSGTVPAWISSRTDVNAALKQGARGSTGDRKRHLFRAALIVSELSLALVLLAGAGYFVRGMQRYSSADMGWKPEGLVTASLTLPYNDSYRTDAQCRAFFDKLGSKLEEIPGVEKATIATYLPIVGFWRSSPILVEGRPPPVHGKETVVYMNSVTPGHFDTIGIRLKSGRDFGDLDRAEGKKVAVINETMARVLWPGENPVGKRIAGADPGTPSWVEVVGVVGDVHPALELVRPPDTPFQVYLPLVQTPTQYDHWFNIAVRSKAPPTALAAAIRAAVQQVDADQPVYAISSADESIREQITSGFTLTGRILGAFALVGLALSAVGTYGVISHLVAQRTSEIGIRMALGAQAGDVLWLVLGQGVRLAVIGSAIGLALSWGLVRVLSAAVPSLPGSDPVVVVAVAAVLCGVAVFASWLPARRATRIDPISALRAD